jgi:hypothetical protein
VHRHAPAHVLAVTDLPRSRSQGRRCHAGLLSRSGLSGPIPARFRPDFPVALLSLRVVSGRTGDQADFDARNSQIQRHLEPSLTALITLSRTSRTTLTGR